MIRAIGKLFLTTYQLETSLADFLECDKDAHMTVELTDEDIVTVITCQDTTNELNNKQYENQE